MSRRARAGFTGVGALMIAMAWSGVAGAVECDDWQRFDAAAKSAKLDAMIDGHLNSNVGKRYTSENPVRMRRCLERFKPDIIDQFDGACFEGRKTAKDALDQIFDKYFLSCVQ